MKRRTMLGITLALILTGVLASSLGNQQMKSITAAGTTWYVGPLPSDFVGIQEAINYENVSDGDVIEVKWKDTPYYENVTVNKSLTIRHYAYDPPGYYPTVDGGNSKGTVFRIRAPNVEIRGFVIQKGSYGVYLSDQTATVANNTIRWNVHGIFLAGRYNTLGENKIVDNAFNFGASGSIQYVDQSNTVNGKPIYYLVNETNKQISGNVGYLAIVNSTRITAQNLSLESNYQGVLVTNSSEITIKDFKCQFPQTELVYGIALVNSNNSIIQNVTFSDVDYAAFSLSFSEKNQIQNNIITTSTLGTMALAVELDWSNNNTIIDNVVQNYYTASPQGTGFILIHSLDNRIIANNVSGMERSFSLEKSNGSLVFCNNIWEPYFPSIWGSVNNRFDNGREGNYWNNYNGADGDGDGIGDTPHMITGTSDWDNFPLIMPRSVHREFERPMGEPKPSEDYIQKLCTVSNSTLGIAPFGFTFNKTLKQVTLKVTSGYAGFLNITIPRSWLDGPFTVWINETKLIDQSMPPCNATHCKICITYEPGRYTVEIEAEELGSIEGDLNSDGFVNAKDAIILGVNFGANG